MLSFVTSIRTSPSALLLCSCLTLLAACSSQQRPPVDGSVDSAAPDAEDDGDAPQSEACTEFEAATALGNVESDELDEISGLVASRAHPGVLWVHNDSGDGARVYAIDRQGRLLGTFELDGASSRDWEDIALGSGPEGDRLFVGDIGDNDRAWVTVMVHRFDEPAVEVDQAPVTERVDAVDTFELAYPDGPHDAEALLIDPTSGDLYIVTKELSGTALVFRAATPSSPSGVITLEQVGQVDLPAIIPLVTGGDVSPAGDAVLLRLYTDVLLWPRPPGAPLADAFSREPVALSPASERQGEAIGYAGDGLGFYTISEGVQPPVHYYEASESCR